jgi:hypothetical protein
VKADKFTNFDLIAESSGSSIATVVVIAGSLLPLSHAISWYFAVFESQRTCSGSLSASCAWLAFISRFRSESALPLTKGALKLDFVLIRQSS